MPKDFKKHFTKDLGKAITKGRKEVAKTVARSLIEKVRGGQEHLEKIG